MNDTVKGLLPHIYILIALFAVFQALQNATWSHADLVAGYTDILLWSLLMAGVLFFYNYRMRNKND